MQLKYEITLPEFSEMAWVRHRSSIRWIIGICIGVMGFLLGCVFYVYADHGLGLFVIAASIFLLLMQFVIPSLVIRRSYRRNSRMFGMRTVTISDTRALLPTIHSDTLNRHGTCMRNFAKHKN